MMRHLRLVAILVSIGVAGGGALVAFAQSISNGAAPSGMAAESSVKVAASSTPLQSFLWIYDGGARTVLFCYSASTPETGPQYDFKCRARTLADAVAP
jgi:hypothetical protein